MKRRSFSSERSSIRCPSLAVPSVSERHDLRLAAGEQAGAVRARADGDLAGDRPDLLSRSGRRGAASRPRSSCGRGPCRSTRPPSGCSRLVRLSLTPGSPPAGPVGKRQRRPSRRSGRRADAASPTLSSFESCSASVSARRSPLELLPHGRLDERPSASSRGSPRATCAPAARERRPTRSSPSSACRPRARRAPRRSRRRRARPCSLQPRLRSRRRTASSSSSVTAGSSHFGLPALARSSSCASQSLTISLLGEVERLEERRLGHLVGARPRPSSGPSFVPTTIRSRPSFSSDSCSVGLTTSSPSTSADPHGPDRAEERHRRDHQRRRDAVDREDVVRGDHVGGEHRRDALHLVAVALRPERPDRAVDHARGEDRALGRPALRA